MSSIHATATKIRGVSSNVSSNISSNVSRANRSQNRQVDDYHHFDDLVKILSQQFSFRESQKVENIVSSRPGYIRPQNEYFQMRTILESARVDGKISSHSASLAVNLFARMLSRKLWRDKVIFNSRASLNGVLVNYDQRDLMIISRRVARRILRRRFGS